MLVSFLWPPLGVWLLPHSDQDSWVGPSLPSEWQFPEQGHNPQKGVGISSPTILYVAWIGDGKTVVLGTVTILSLPPQPTHH